MRPLRVSVLGAGPAGLYFSLLLKKAQPDHDITVLERNPADATYGWGVVFSEETLGALRDADQATYLEITDTFARWDAIDIRYRGRTVRSRGHSFSAIARRTLLGILQRRCRDVGVRLEFGTEVTDPSTLDGDLVVAADGVNSLIRRSRDKAFGGRITPQGCKYVWYGTDLVFDAFTFLFKETEHGMFQVHGYPFDEDTSTFIVECPRHTWESAGLDKMDEAQSMAFCADLFAEELGGHKLKSNKSLWLDFPRLVTKHWHDGKTVLLGDSAHTAHFTIGSGTKLAMEDAIALAAALDRHTEVGPALVDYELDRKPVIDRFQQAAASSADYFERVSSHTGLDPLPFAFNLLTRSGRIGHASLSVRDPAFVRAVDSWHGTGGESTGAVCPPPLFTPFRVGDLLLHNRIVQDTPGGGLLLVGTEPVTNDGRRTPSDGLKWTSVVESAQGAAVGLRIGHAGRRGATREPTHGVDVPLPADQAWPLVAASPIPYGPRSAVPQELDGDGMARIRDAFVAMARKAAEFDLLELDMAHGFLLGGFLSPLTNKRTDDYGGDLDARLRYPLDVLRAVREAWSKPLSVRLSVTDWAARGTTPDDGVAMARAMAEAGADLVHVAAGQTVPESTPEYRRGFLTPLADRVRSEAGVPTMVGGYLTTLDEVNTVIAASRADLCVLTPPDREWPA
jgi:anthraniloyl-CoA monooxygenase